MTKEQIGNLFRLMLEYIPPTLKIFGFTLLWSIPLGMIVALLKMCKFKPISWLTNIYILIMRGTPLLLQLIVAQYSVPYLLKWEGCPSFIHSLLDGVDIRSASYTFNMLLIAFVLNYAAYFAEIFRGGIEAIPKGQYEAAGALGFSRIQTFFRIILPQVIKRVVPASSNEIITLVKDTSLGYPLHGDNVHRQEAGAHLCFSPAPFYGRRVLFRIRNRADAFVRIYREKAQLLQIRRCSCYVNA